MKTSALQRAERCFALARSTTFAGERDAAIALGTSIAERAGLSLDLFDILGRERRRPGERARRAASETRPGYRRSFAEGGQYTREELHDVMARFNAHMAEGGLFRDAFGSYAASYTRAAANAGAGEDETVYDARRRNFEEATRAAAERDAAHERRRG